MALWPAGDMPPGAEAVTFERGEIRAEFEADLSPSARPRTREVPVRFAISGRVGSTTGELPQLRRMEIAVHPRGRIDGTGLPACKPRQIRTATHEHAVGACRASVIGSGVFVATLSLPDQGPVTARGNVAVFHSATKRGDALLAHIWAEEPLRLSALVPLKVVRTRKETVLRSPSLPRILGEQVHAVSFSFRLGRVYRSEGRRRSYLRAGCPAPPGAPAALFRLASASYWFTDGRSMSQGIVKACRVKGAGRRSRS